jgi:hypothetical protein
MGVIMIRFARFALAGAFAVVTSASVEAQQQAPQPQQVQPPKGQPQQVQPPQGQPQQVQPPQGQQQLQPPQGQQQVQPPQGQKVPTVQPNPGQQGVYSSGMSQTPWFSNQDIRQHFKLTDQQFNQLNQTYGEHYGIYQQGVNKFGKDLNPEQRFEKMQELQQRFNKDFSATANNVFTDPQQRQRYNQVYLQYQGYNAFSDPSVQEKLNLTPEQRQQIAQYGQDWDKRMNDLGRTYQTDREGSTKQFNEMRTQSGERLNTVLTPEQQKSWQQMTGEPYQFQPSVYFQTGTGVAPGTPKQGKRE